VAALVSLSVPLLLFVSCEDKIVQEGAEPNPVPSLSAISPVSAVLGGSGFTLTMTGSRFISGSAVIWNGAERATEFVSATEIRATILASDIAPSSPKPEATDDENGFAAPSADDTVQVWVRNPEPGGGTSAPLPFVRLEVRPAPAITSISPTKGVIGGGDLTLTVSGFGFHPQSVVRWDSGDLATTYASENFLTAVIPSDSLVSSASATISVFNPAPGGGASNGVSFAVVPPNPVPTITSLSPSTVTAGGAGFDLTVTGGGFVSGAVLSWGIQQRATAYLSDTSVRASILNSDVADGGTVMVTVSNPPPGGGTSNALAMTIENPTPVITELNPASASAGTPGRTVSVLGSGFVRSSVVRWNGSERPTTFFDSDYIQVGLSAADLASPGSGSVSVINPAPGGGVSGEVPFTVYVAVAIAANDLVYEPVSGKLFASVPSTGGAIGNTVSAIDPTTGAIVSSVFVGSEPNPLARSDDGKYLYVGLDGSSSVRRYEVETETAGIQFQVGTDPFYGALRAEDIEVLPGLPGTVAISLIRPGVSPRHGGVFIYDDGVRRAQGTQEHTGSNRIEPSASATRLYGYNNETTEFGFRQLTVSASGVTETAVQQDLISGFGVDIAFSGGKVFATTGVVINPETFTQLGTFAAYGAMVPDESIHRAFFLRTSPSKAVAVFDTGTFLEVGEVPIDAVGGSSRRIVRVGTDAVAFIANSSTVVILRHPLLGP